MWNTACLISPANPVVGFTLLQTRIDLRRTACVTLPSADRAPQRSSMLQIAVDGHFRLASMGGKAQRPYIRYYPDVAEEKASLGCSGDGPRLSAGATAIYALPAGRISLVAGLQRAQRKPAKWICRCAKA